MAIKLNKYPIILQHLAKRKSQLEKKIIIFYEKKHLSDIVPSNSNKKNSMFKEKLDELIKWYDEFTGMDVVRFAQKRVLEDEERFRQSQERRRNAVNELTEIQTKLKEVHAELEATTKGEDRYIKLVTEEHKLLKEEKNILDKFKQAEKIERDSFAALSSSVKLSHEKERAQSERTKYWSIIGSIMGTVIGILGSSISNHFKMNELKEVIKTSSDKKLVDEFNKYVEVNEDLLNKLKNETIIPSCNACESNEDSLKQLNLKLNEVEECLKSLEEKTLKSGLSKNDHDVTISVDKLAENMKKEITQTKMLLFTLAVLSIIMPIITRYT